MPIAPSMPYTSTFAPSAVPRNESFWQCMLRLNVDDTPPDTVILQEHERPDKYFTYASVLRMAGLGAEGLQSVLGLQRGDTILIVGTNTLDYLHLEFSALWIGIVAALGNASATTNDLVHLIDTAQPAAVFCDPGALMASMTVAIAQSTQPRAHLVGIGERGTASLAFPADFIKDAKAEPGEGPLDLSGDDSHTVPALVCFSSGTTSGRPKAAVLSHYNVLAYPLLYRASEPTTANRSQRDVFYAPLAHIYGVFVATTMPVLTGGYVRLLRSYTLPNYLAACSETRATTLRMVPPTLVAMVKLLQAGQDKDKGAQTMDLSSVHTIVCAGAMLAPEMIGAVHALLGDGVAIVQAYGMTEGLATVVSRYAGAQGQKQGSVGRPLSGGQLRIVDDELHDVPAGASGEIVFTSPTVFMGYKNDDAATAEAFPLSGSGRNTDGNGWLRSGDVGRMDADGFLWLTDRKKDMIKYKGHQVSPAELENVLHAHPMVQEAGVCAAWDAVQQTEVPVGYVNLVPSVSQEDRAAVVRQVQAFVDGQVAHQKKLRGGLFHLATMPRNATGKLLRRNLPARLEAARKSKL